MGVTCRRMGGCTNKRACRHNKPIFIFLSTQKHTGVQMLLSLQVVVVEQILKICRWEKKKMQRDKKTGRVMRINPSVSQNSSEFRPAKTSQILFGGHFYPHMLAFLIKTRFIKRPSLRPGSHG